MLLMLVGVVGCQQEILQVMGAVTGIVVSAHPAASVADVVGTAAPVAAIAPIEIGPAAVPAPVEAAEAVTEDATLASAAPDAPAPAAPRPPPADFNPISMPQGPRDSPGVRWEGVKGKTTNSELRKDTLSGR